MGRRSLTGEQVLRLWSLLAYTILALLDLDDLCRSARHWRSSIGRSMWHEPMRIAEATSAAGHMMDRATSTSDLLDQAIQVCRREIRSLMSILLVLHLLNITFVRLVQSFFGPTVSRIPDWLLPSALGDLPAVLLARPAGTPARFVLVLLDLLIMQSCYYTLLIPVFAQRSLPPLPRQRSAAHRLSTFVQLLIPAGVLLGLTGLGTLLVFAIVPNDFMFVLLIPSTLAPTVLRTLLALALFGLVAQFLYSRVYLACYIVVCEGVPGIASLRRSWRLTRGAWWRSTSVVLATQGLIYLLATFPVLLVVSSPLTGWDVAQLAIMDLLSSLSAQLFTIVAVPVHIGAGILLYYDLRKRGEGYDLEQQIHSQIDSASQGNAS
jgi:hypothetical protein